MKNIAIVYWSGTGNTKIMAESIKEGAGDSAKLFSAEEFKAEMLNDFDACLLYTSIYSNSTHSCFVLLKKTFLNL